MECSRSEVNWRVRWIRTGKFIYSKASRHPIQINRDRLHLPTVYCLCRNARRKCGPSASRLDFKFIAEHSFDGNTCFSIYNKLQRLPATHHILSLIELYLLQFGQCEAHKMVENGSPISANGRCGWTMLVSSLRKRRLQIGITSKTWGGSCSSVDFVKWNEFKNPIMWAELGRHQSSVIGRKSVSDKR